jgi:hypothetical protein
VKWEKSVGEPSHYGFEEQEDKQSMTSQSRYSTIYLVFFCSILKGLPHIFISFCQQYLVKLHCALFDNKKF